MTGMRRERKWKKTKNRRGGEEAYKKIKKIKNSVTR